MATPERQILLCQNFRVKGDPKGICHKQTDGFLQYIEEEILDRGLDMQVVATGCLIPQASDKVVEAKNSLQDFMAKVGRSPNS